MGVLVTGGAGFIGSIQRARIQFVPRKGRAGEIHDIGGGRDLTRRRLRRTAQAALAR